MAKILISYRRQDSDYISGRIYDSLCARFDAEQLIKDIDSIPLGVDFRQQIATFIEDSDLVLLIIGPQWLGVNTATGLRRIDSPNDFVRYEIELALRRNIPIIPVLVQHATIPDAGSLPPSINAISYRNGIEVRPDPDFLRDMERLIHGIETIVPNIQQRVSTTNVYSGTTYPQQQTRIPSPTKRAGRLRKKVIPQIPLRRALLMMTLVGVLSGIVNVLLLSYFGYQYYFLIIPLLPFLSGLIIKRLTGFSWGAITGFLTGALIEVLLVGKYPDVILARIVTLYLIPGALGSWVATFYLPGEKT